MNLIGNTLFKVHKSCWERHILEGGDRLVTNGLAIITLNCFDNSFDFYQQILISNFGEIFLKTFSKLNFHPFDSNS